MFGNNNVLSRNNDPYVRCSTGKELEDCTEVRMYYYYYNFCYLTREILEKKRTIIVVLILEGYESYTNMLCNSFQIINSFIDTQLQSYFIYSREKC